MKEGRPYYDLDVWKKARTLVSEVYDLTKFFPEHEKFALTSQIRRAVVSVPSNIAEGIGRQHKKEQIQFMYISRGSLYELETQLFLALDQRYISEEQLSSALERITDCKRLGQGFINYLKSKSEAD